MASSKILPTWHLLVQSRKWKHQSNARNMFKVNKKDIVQQISQNGSSISFVDFEQVNSSRVMTALRYLWLLIWDTLNINFKIYAFSGLAIKLKHWIRYLPAAPQYLTGFLFLISMHNELVWWCIHSTLIRN